MVALVWPTWYAKVWKKTGLFELSAKSPENFHTPLHCTISGWLKTDTDYFTFTRDRAFLSSIVLRGHAR